MFCIHCGAQIPEAAKFCPSCGTQIANGAQPTYWQPAYQPPRQGYYEAIAQPRYAIYQ